MNHAFDSKALELSRKTMGLMYGPMPVGGSCQLQAQIQNLFIEAMQFAAPAVQAEPLSVDTLANALRNAPDAPSDNQGKKRGNSPAIPDAIDANLVEALRLVQCMLEDYRERNHGDAERWIRHINDLMSDYSEAHGDDAYSVLHGLLPAAPKQEAE
ncbi:hypothetical protein V5074_20130 [Atlantibacter hermannii]|uniref:hypothetical protein n=1 Tax=Atlantibacter hermannii TaxID=565 RepID=UPI0030763D90